MNQLREDRQNEWQAAPGFTLIEISIVLVIIGLITGGVLVGQDLIRTAGVRATIPQIQGYNTAVNVFRNQYFALPGAMIASMAIVDTRISTRRCQSQKA